MYNVGVVVGRFQVDELTSAHREILSSVAKMNDRLLVIIGVPALQGTWRNPLDFQTRAAMIRQSFKSWTTEDNIRPNCMISIIPLHDRESDEVWSQSLDAAVGMLFPDANQVTLYHARDGFGEHYHGRYDCHDLSWEIPAQHREVSGTKIREQLGKVPGGTAEFRHGVIYASQHVWPHVKAVVDVIMWRSGTKVIGSHGWVSTDESQVLLGRKEHETFWRLPGGMIDPSDPSMEFAATRELLEETGLTCEGTPVYICSKPIDDWRHRDLPNESFYTTCFACQYSFGVPVAGDDLCEVKWFSFEEAEELLRSEHKELFSSFLLRLPL
jgi:8-oxo-dGTP pyrophosphatase MutT (NUDIX family)